MDISINVSAHRYPTGSYAEMRRRAVDTGMNQKHDAGVRGRLVRSVSRRLRRAWCSMPPWDRDRATTVRRNPAGRRSGQSLARKSTGQRDNGRRENDPRRRIGDVVNAGAMPRPERHAAKWLQRRVFPCFDRLPRLAPGKPNARNASAAAARSVESPAGCRASPRSAPETCRAGFDDRVHAASASIGP